MANSLTHVLPYPIRNARFTLPVPFATSTGVPTDPTTPDTEFSSDGGATFADCAEEITTGGTYGAGYLTLTGAETNNNLIWIAARSANDQITRIPIYPRILAAVGSGTLSAGSAGGGTLGTLLAYDVTGCFIRITGGTGGGGTGGANNQARKITTYVTSTGAFTVTPNWETTPDATTTYDILLPEGVTLGMLRTINPITSGGNDVDVGKVAASAIAATRLSQMFAAARLITVDNATLSPTTTAFETDQTVDAADRYTEQVLFALDGNNVGVTVPITGYAFTNSKVKLTVEALPTAPSNAHRFLIMGRIEQ